MSEIDYAGLPETLRAGMCRYIEERLETGSFLMAVLENDLFEAVTRADRWNQVFLGIIVMWLATNAPAECWGSKEKVAKWLEKGKEGEEL